MNASGLRASVRSGVTIVCLLTGVGSANAAAPVSYIDLSTAKEIMMVDGKPFWYAAAQISIFRLMDEHRFTWPQIKRVFEAAADTGFTTVGVPLLWDKIETSRGVYDWSSIDIPIDFGAGRGLKIEIIYMGSDLCGAYPIPYEVADTVQRVLKSDGTVARKNGVDKLDKADPILLRNEQAFLRRLFDHIRSYTDSKQYPHTVVGVQLLNESMASMFFTGITLTDRSYSEAASAKWTAGGYSNAKAFNADVLWEYIEGLGRAVKGSNYSVWTRANFVCAWEQLCDDLIARNEAARSDGGTALDFIGNDPYDSNAGSIYDYCVNGVVARGRNLPMVMENAGSFPNTAQLLFAAVAGDCRYQVWEMNSSILQPGEPGTNQGLYATNRSRRTISPKPHVRSTARLLRMLDKDRADLASLQAGSSALKFFNRLSAPRADETLPVNGRTIRFTTSDRGGGIVAARSNAYVFLATASGTFHVPATFDVTSLEAGYFDANDAWVRQRRVSWVTSAAGRSFKIHPYEVIRLTQ
jgi:Domain of unknown function (DUF4978)